MSLLLHYSTVICAATTLTPIVDPSSFFNKLCCHEKSCQLVVYIAGRQHGESVLLILQYFSFSLKLQAQSNVSIKSSWNTANSSFFSAAVKTVSILRWTDIKIYLKSSWIPVFSDGGLFKKQFLSKIQFELFLLLWIIHKTPLKNMTCFTSFKHIIQEKIFLFIWPYGRCCTSPVHMPWYWYSRWHINGVTSFTTDD